MRHTMQLDVCLLGIGLLVGVPALGQDDGAIVGWGDRVVVPQSALSGLIGVAAGGDHSLGLKADGSIAAWGWNDYGQCNVPAPNSGFVAIAGGRHHSLGL